MLSSVKSIFTEINYLRILIKLSKYEKHYLSIMTLTFTNHYWHIINVHIILDFKVMYPISLK